MDFLEKCSILSPSYSILEGGEGEREIARNTTFEVGGTIVHIKDYTKLLLP